MLRVQRLGPLVLLVVGVVGAVLSVRLSLGALTRPGPGFWPFVVSLLVVATAALLLWVDDHADYERWTRGAAGIALGAACLLVFVALFATLGLVVSVALLLLFWLRVFARRSWRSTVLLAVGGTAVIYLVFDLALGVPLPEPLAAFGLTVTWGG